MVFITAVLSIFSLKVLRDKVELQDDSFQPQRTQSSQS
jgi:hypothetical protein